MTNNEEQPRTVEQVEAEPKSRCCCCYEQIHPNATVCPHCQHHQKRHIRLLAWVPAISLVGSLFALWLAAEQATEARSERLKAEEAVETARVAADRADEAVERANQANLGVEAAIALAAKTQDGLNNSRQELEMLMAGADQMSIRVSLLRGDYQEAGNRIKGLSRQAEENEHLLAETKIGVAALRENLSNLELAALSASDVVYATNFNHKFGRTIFWRDETEKTSGKSNLDLDILTWIGHADLDRVWHACADDTDSNVPTPPTARCLTAALGYRIAIAYMAEEGLRLRPMMSEKAWGTYVAASFCPSNDALLLRFGRDVSFDLEDYERNESWSRFSGLAARVYEITKLYLEDTLTPDGVCTNFEFEPLSRASMERRIRSEISTAGFLIGYPDRTEVLYEWKIGDEPKFRQEAAPYFDFGSEGDGWR